MSTPTSHKIVVTLPNNIKRLILFNHEANALVDQYELSNYIYQKLKSDNINPCTHWLYYCLDGPSPQFQLSNQWRRHPKPKHIELRSNQPLEVICISYNNIVYTSQTNRPVESREIFCFDVAYKVPKLRANEIAFQFASGEIWFRVAIAILIYLIIIAAVTLIVGIDILYDEVIAPVLFPQFVAVIHAVWHLYLYKSSGWIIIDMIDENNPDQDVIYIKTGYFLDRCFNKKHVLDMDKFRGIRIEGSCRRNIEKDEGSVCVLVFDDQNHCCRSNSWAFRTRLNRDTMVYYEIAKFFKQRYGQRDGYNLRFSIPNKLREELRNCGVRDRLLNGNGAWKDEQFLDSGILSNGDEDELKDCLL
eukprot:273281_1